MSNPLRKIWRGYRTLVNHINHPMYLSWAMRHRRRLAQFENSHFGKSCFIIGNGPSLNETDLSRLHGIHCFGLNKIYLHPSFNDLRIDYHVAVNPLVIEQSIAEFERLSCPSFLSFGACYSRKLVSKDFYYLFTDGAHYFSKDVYEPISEGCTVTYVALQLAFFMGFRRVFLVGMDHKFDTHGEPHEKQLLVGADENHFHPDYFGGKEWHLPDLEGSEVAYHLANYYFRKSGRKVYDATIGGNLRIFPKIDFEEALAVCRGEASFNLK